MGETSEVRSSVDGSAGGGGETAGSRSDGGGSEGPVKAADVLAAKGVELSGPIVRWLSEAAGGGDFAVVGAVLYAVGGSEVASDYDDGPEDGVLVLLAAPVLGEPDGSDVDTGRLTEGRATDGD